MTRQEIINFIGEWFRIEPEENGEYDINSYDFQAGCYHNGRWLNLAEVVKMAEELLQR